MAQPLVATGQQIGAGWTPALSVVKALAALAAARNIHGEAVYWLADEDHDRIEVASTVGYQGMRLLKHRFRFDAPPHTAAGWLPWNPAHQAEAESLWGEVPTPDEPSLRGHVLALGRPLWERGIRPFSPTHPSLRDPIQGELARWRRLPLESALIQQADRITLQGHPLPLDPREQSPWFSLDPITGIRRRLASDEPVPPGHWLSPGAALRPLMQSLMLPVTHVVLGPAERAYWRLTEPLWEQVGLEAPIILPRPTIFVRPQDLEISVPLLEALREGRWAAFVDPTAPLPSQALDFISPSSHWSPGLSARFSQRIAQTQSKLERLDRRLRRDLAEKALGMDPEKARQALFPLQKPQERILPGLLWLRDSKLLDRMLHALETPSMTMLVEQS